MQVNELIPSLQVPPFLHGLDAHSSMFVSQYFRVPNVALAVVLRVFRCLFTDTVVAVDRAVSKSAASASAFAQNVIVDSGEGGHFFFDLCDQLKVCLQRGHL